MSAFMVSKKHIDALVAVAVFGPQGYRTGRWNAPYFGSAPEIGNLLISENLSSIHSRYPDTIDRPDGTPGPIEQYWLQPYQFPFGFCKPAHLPNAVQALRLISCYEYQSCEHQGWKDSEAKAFCETLRGSLISCLVGYDDAPWEWDEADVL